MTCNSTEIKQLGTPDPTFQVQGHSIQVELPLLAFELFGDGVHRRFIHGNEVNIAGDGFRVYAEIFRPGDRVVLKRFTVIYVWHHSPTNLLDKLLNFFGLLQLKNKPRKTLDEVCSDIQNTLKVLSTPMTSVKMLVPLPDELPRMDSFS